MAFLATLLSKSEQLPDLARIGSSKRPPVSDGLTAASRASGDDVLRQLGTSFEGLTAEQVEERLQRYGPNEVAQEKRLTLALRFFETVRNPLVILLLALATISYATGDLRATLVMLVMVALGVGLRFFQEMRADKAAEQLKAMVRTTATVVRGGQTREVALQDLVPGDIIRLAAGDMIPADVRLLSAKDLFVNQSTLTGEALPVEKTASTAVEVSGNALDMPNLCFLGSNVETGSGTAVVVLTGGRTYFGALASSIAGRRELTSFDRGVNGFTWLMIRFMMVMVPAVFIINGLSKGNWLEAFLFALAVAVGLTPEMLPMIVTVNLSKGAIAMSRQKVIVKRLNAIQNFGAMDVLCTDKTGTITQGRVILERHLDICGDDDARVLKYGYLNSFYQTGLKNLLDVAVLEHVQREADVDIAGYVKIDEIPFDFLRRRMSVVVRNGGCHTLICKGAVEELLALCTSVDIQEAIYPMTAERRAMALKLARDLNEDGFRVIALCYREMSIEDRAYSVQDERDLTLLGFLAFLDPPKLSAQEAVAKLGQHGVSVKILTGDNDVVTTAICRHVGLPVERALLGRGIDELSDAEFAEFVEHTTVFAKLSPSHKERIIRSLQARGHVVGFMGDGINDAPALRAADVGISVNTAVDIAKESSDIILLENSLMALEDGVVEGRKVFGNIVKYIKMAASSNFGNMFSVVGGSLFLPFLPMLPLQVLTNNLLYDFSQVPIPTDEVDEEWLRVPRKWSMDAIRRFILFIGPISSIFDYLTYFMMLLVFNAWHNEALFHTGWFIESLFTQTLIIHVIRTNKIPFLQSRASVPLTLTSLAVVAAGAWLPVSPLAEMLGFTPLPGLYWPLLLGMLLCYVVLTQGVKLWFIRRWGG